ncbi:serine/threonine protein kinase [Tolypothrix bouteillei VB521301]|uniref:non-specific serine/threonine protein kinase n=1 Tax=Tolypothrix bouteillei VB521301 TaxID=1479485 RepID=A0A8S9SVX6_9CYAN|nr:serine/threonine protein kinase [Tolypothrix bouteillei VB521301]
MSYCLNPNCPKPTANHSNNKFCTTCGSKLLLAERYRAIKLLGQGGFGRTFLAIDEYKPSQRHCVVKQLLPQAQGTNTLNKASELFKLEAERLDELGHNHPQIPELLAYFTQESQQYLVQEFIDGQNLAEEVTNNGVYSEKQIIALLRNLLPVLQFVHGKQVIHRDIKPENIIRRRDGELVLVDFGASKTTTRTALTVTGTAIGTAGYTAPEQALGKATVSSDIYSLGVTCLYLLTGVEPFELFDVTEGEWVWRDYLSTQLSSNLALFCHSRRSIMNSKP